MSENLTNRCVLITGASSGIGKACAEAFAAQSCRLLLTARRKERLDELSAVLRERHGTEVLTEALDVRDREAVDEWVEGLPESWSGIDLLVNNAGLARGLAPLHEGDVADWEEMIDTNLKGLLWVTRAVLPGMITRGRGHVINIGSIAGHEVYPSGNVYCATKHAVAALSRSLGIDTVPRRCGARGRGLRGLRGPTGRGCCGGGGLLCHPSTARQRPRDDPHAVGAGGGGAFARSGLKSR